tara:strand:+ start:306 stop:713 length:408 start_codon:yes stop_codon:yes gene_type:complete
VAFSLDPVAFYAQSSGLGEDKDPLNPYQNFSASNAKSYGSKFGQGLDSGFGLGGDSGFTPSGTGLQQMVGASVADNQMETELATGALNNMTNYKIAKMQRELAASQGAKNRSAGTRNAIIGAVGGIGAAAIGAAI